MNTALPADEEDLQFSAEVPETLAGSRLDVACARLFDAYSRSRLQQWIAGGRLQVDGQTVTAVRTPVTAGSLLLLDAEPEPDTEVNPQDLPLEIVHQDAALAIIHKPAGLTVHPGAGQRASTLQNALLYHLPQTAAVPRAGIIHRLDKDTSGLLVVALTLSAHARLVAQLAAREIRREYDAVVQGSLVAGGTVEAPIGRHPRDRLKMAVLDRGGREATTHYRVHAHFGHHTHLRVRLETGRTHQIRVHMTHLRHSIVGDSVYGGEAVRGQGLPESLRAALKAFPRQALHARELALAHPLSGKPLEITREPPADMQALLALLREQDPRR
jgi:23S rRNA pseudouridine1911/1915/1917 synthase